MKGWGGIRVPEADLGWEFEVPSRGTLNDLRKCLIEVLRIHNPGYAAKVVIGNDFEIHGDLYVRDLVLRLRCYRQRSVG